MFLELSNGEYINLFQVVRFINVQFISGPGLVRFEYQMEENGVRHDGTCTKEQFDKKVVRG